MKIELLVSTMYENNVIELYKKMNIQSDAIVINQCDKIDFEKKQVNGSILLSYSFDEKGIGLSRNNALMRATGDICLFSDDDMIYKDGYEQIILEAFSKLKDADVLVFNLEEKIKTRYIIEKIERVGWFNYLRYGTARMAIRRKSVLKYGIFFNQLFGGGTKYSHGEDNLFLTECLRKGLKIYAVPETIAILTDERPSSWYTGYNEKYFLDQGSLYYCISKKYWRLLCFQDCLRHRKKFMSFGKWTKCFRLMIKGGLTYDNKE